MQSVEVDNDFARFGGKSYAINKINTVEVREQQPHGIAGAAICGIAAALALTSVFNNGGMGAIVITLIFGGLAYHFWKMSQIREYHLFLMTSSSETQAFVSRDQDEVFDLRQRIETAMLSHSRSGMPAVIDPKSATLLNTMVKMRESNADMQAAYRDRDMSLRAETVTIATLIEQLCIAIRIEALTGGDEEERSTRAVAARELIKSVGQTAGVIARKSLGEAAITADEETDDK